MDGYKKGAHTVLNIKYHYVWKTKYGYEVLSGGIALRVRELIREICQEKDVTIVKGHVRPNHIHIMVSAPSHLSIAKIAQFIKGKSAHRLFREFPELRKRYWGQHLGARGYFCTTVGAVNEETAKRYIEEQDDVPAGFKVWNETSSDSKIPLGA